MNSYGGQVIQECPKIAGINAKNNTAMATIFDLVFCCNVNTEKKVKSI